ncbi:MAG: YihY/virulence factor BrkB family protein [Pseudomonadota bacterium]
MPPPFAGRPGNPFLDARRPWLVFFRHIADEFGRDNLMHVAAGIAFYGLLALFPGITAALSLVVLLVDPETVMRELTRFAEILPDEAAIIVLDQARAVTAANASDLGFGFFLGLALALYSASKGMQSLIDGLNMAHNEIETRGFLYRYFLRITLTAVLVLGLLVGISTALIIPAAMHAVGIDQGESAAVAAARWPVMGVLTIVGLRIIYRFAPNHSRPDGSILTWGTVLAAAAWVAASLGFSWYVSNFASYNETFGALGGVIVLLMWLWISGVVILIGAEIDATLELMRDARRAGKNGG